MQAAQTPNQTQFDTSFEARLAKIDLTDVMAHVARETDLSPADLVRAEQLYRQFLTLKAKFPEVDFFPPKLVDHVWDSHVVHTRQYAADCELLFGAYLHHTPHHNPANRVENFETFTVPAYQREFGVNLKAYGVAASTPAFCS